MKLSGIFLTLLFILLALNTCAAQESRKEAESYIFTDDRVLPRDYRIIEHIIPVDPAIYPADSVQWEPAGEGMRRKAYFNDRLTAVLLQIDRPVKVDRSRVEDRFSLLPGF